MKQEDIDKLLEKAKEDYKTCREYWDEIFEQGDEDIRFLYGIDQWDAQDVANRSIDNKPSLTLNQLLPYAHQITNDIRQTRMAIRTSPVDDKGDVDTAEILDGVIRNIERVSNAQTAYITGATNAIGASVGWIKVETDYVDEMSFNQEARIERVLNFKSVMIDPNFKELDGHDAEYGFETFEYTKEEFEEAWPDKEAVSFGDSDASEKDITIVDYYYTEYTEIEINRVRYEFNGQEVIGVITDREIKSLEEKGIIVEVLETRDTKIPTIKKCTLSGCDVLEETTWIGKYIPLVPVFGEEAFIDDKRMFLSFINQAKDGQRMYNYHKSESTFLLAMQPRAPWIAPTGSFKSHPNDWAEANSTSVATLEYDPVHDKKTGQLLPPPQRQMPPQGSPAVMQEAMGAKEDIRLAIGMPQANMGERGNEVSGVAIRNRQIEGDNATFHIIDNLATAITHVGRILVDIIPKLYKDETIARIIGEDGVEKNVPINQPFVKDKELGYERPVRKDEKQDGIYDLNVGQYDVVTDVGASYSSKRQETADKLIELIRARPEIVEVTGDIVVESLDIPDGKVIADRLRSQMPPEILGDEPMAEKLKQSGLMIKDLQEKLLNMEAIMENKQKDMRFEQDKTMKELDLKKAELIIDAEKVQAEIDKIYSDIENGASQGDVKRLDGVIRQLIDQVEDVTAATEIQLEAFGMDQEKSEADSSDAQ